MKAFCFNTKKDVTNGSKDWPIGTKNAPYAKTNSHESFSSFLNGRLVLEVISFDKVECDRKVGQEL
jgi:hypothetical protein